MRTKNLMVMFLVLGMLGLTLSLFAYGQGDESGKQYGQREEFEKRYKEFLDLVESKEKVSLTGVLVINNRVIPELKAGNEVYKLMAPRFCPESIQVDEGTEVLLEGVFLTVKKDVHTRVLNGGEKVFFVTKAIIDGKEYTPEEDVDACRGPHKGPRRGGFTHMGHHRPGLHGPGPLIDIFE